MQAKSHLSCSFSSTLTSRHDVPHILYSQSGVLVFRVHPDDTVAQATHGKDGTGRERRTRHSGSTRVDSSQSNMDVSIC